MRNLREDFTVLQACAARKRNLWHFITYLVESKQIVLTEVDDAPTDFNSS